MHGYVALLLFAAGVLWPATGVHADDVTIYRCTDAGGHLTLGDTPCTRGQKQETRTMLRPRDGVAPLPPSAQRIEQPAPPPSRLLVVAPPRPLYECVTPDGDHYTSDTGEGNPRWVPLWTLGFPVVHSGFRGVDDRAGLGINRGEVRIDGARTMLRGSDRGAVAYGAGTWVRDQCYALPQEEVCSRLVDRRDEIRRRFFNAMPSERDVLRVEERGVNARLDNDCGSH